MNYSFNAQSGLIIISAKLVGTTGSVVLRLALDTGATRTLVNTGLLVAVGYDPALVPNRLQITTGSGVEFVPQVSVEQLLTLGHKRENFEVLAHTLPPSTSVDGLLGLDFLRDHKLTVNFKNGILSIN